PPRHAGRSARARWGLVYHSTASNDRRPCGTRDVMSTGNAQLPIPNHAQRPTPNRESGPTAPGAIRHHALPFATFTEIPRAALLLGRWALGVVGRWELEVGS